MGLLSGGNSKQNTTSNQTDMDFNNVDSGLVEGADLSTNLNFNLSSSNLGGVSVGNVGGSTNIGSSVTQGVGLGGDVGGGGLGSSPGAPIIAIETTDQGAVQAGKDLALSALDIVKGNAQDAYGSLATTMESNGEMFDKALDASRSANEKSLSEILMYGTVAVFILGGFGYLAKKAK